METPVNHGSTLSGPRRKVIDMPTNAPGDAQNHGEVFTRRWVVELMLNQIGYVSEADLTRVTLLEPSIGGGAFARVVCERLAESKNRHWPSESWMRLAGAVSGWDLLPEHVEATRSQCSFALQAKGCPKEAADALVELWFRQGDFLLEDLGDVKPDVIVGNPPYIRIEDLDPLTLQTYRKRYPTMSGRADIFVGFYERSLDLLAEGGQLAFICADRWMLNDYGKRLRRKLVDGPFAIMSVLSMHDVDVFETEVSAYPAITVIARKPQGPVLVAECSNKFNQASGKLLIAAKRDSRKLSRIPDVKAAVLPNWHNTETSWPVGSPAVIAWLERLEETLPLIEDSSPTTRIGIGVATGADAVYVKDMDELPAVEPDRILPLSVSADVTSGVFSWTGQHLISPWNQEGLVDLADYPKLAAYYESYSQRLLGRNVAKKRPKTWYRTIDRVNLDLLKHDMLVLGDMRKHARPVRVKAGYYPHHNLYFIVSDEWNLDVLGGLLMSQQVEAQVAAYCVKMRGGTLRFQAQYLRRVRVPKPTSIPVDIANELSAAFRDQDALAATTAANALFAQAGVPMPE
jgi:adenine-specific DNA-methyltransferase